MTQGAPPDLRGVTIVLTRPHGRMGAVPTRLADSGAEVWAAPLIEVVYRRPPGLRARLMAAHTLDAVLVTSGNAVRALAAVQAVTGHALADGVPGPEVPTATVTCIAVGAASAASAERLLGWRSCTPPGVVDAETLGDYLARLHSEGPRQRWWFPHGQQANTGWAKRLEADGHEVTDTVVYDTHPAALDQQRWRARLDASRRLVITLFSPSAVQALISQWHTPLRDNRSRIVLACIGQTTAAAVRSMGLQPDCIAPEPSDEALIDEVVRTLTQDG